MNQQITRMDTNELKPNIRFKSYHSLTPLFAPLPPETRKLLDTLPALIDKTFPLPGRFRSSLPSDVAELSRLLTAGRGERSLSYLGRPAMLSAYLRFFLPWNLYRLCRLLPGLDIQLAAHDRITDLGCGPLTFAAALWISRPDLRDLPLEFHCIDRSGPALDAGKQFFAALTGRALQECANSGADSPWKIHTVKGDIAAVKAKPSALVCAVNVFNEMYGDISRASGITIARNAEKTAHLLESHSAAASILVVEPGFPRCGEFISLLRGIFLAQGRLPVSPCTHAGDCPFPGGGKSGRSRSGHDRWCHFAFETKDAPAALHRLSQAAKLPKERAVLSFLFTKGTADKAAAGTATTPGSTPLPLTRVISDPFPLPPDRLGRYCCSPQGLVLLTGTKAAIEQTASGALANVRISEKRDAKSGALIAEEADRTPPFALSNPV